MSPRGSPNESSASNSSSHSYKTYSYHTQLKQAWAGAVAAAVTRTITQPLDVLKIRFQLQVEPLGGHHSMHPWANAAVSQPPPPSSKYTSLLQAVRLINHEEGVRAFWKGHNAGQIMSILYGIVQFWTYEQLHNICQQMPWMQAHSRLSNFMCGGVAGCTSTFVSMPFDVIRTRLVAQDPDAPGGYRNIWSAFPSILRNEGVRGLFRGLISTMMQIGPLVGANFMFYNSFNDVARSILLPADNKLPTWCMLLTGGSAGVASKAVVYPLDFIKKRLQLQGFEKQRQTFGRNQGCTGIIHCIKLTMRQEGVRAFYKGMAPTLLKSGMTTALYFTIYDNLR